MVSKLLLRFMPIIPTLNARNMYKKTYTNVPSSNSVYRSPTVHSPATSV